MVDMTEVLGLPRVEFSAGSTYEKPEIRSIEEFWLTSQSHVACSESPEVQS